METENSNDVPELYGKYRGGHRSLKPIERTDYVKLGSPRVYNKAVSAQQSSLSADATQFYPSTPIYPSMNQESCTGFFFCPFQRTLFFLVRISFLIKNPFFTLGMPLRCLLDPPFELQNRSNIFFCV